MKNSLLLSLLFIVVLMPLQARADGWRYFSMPELSGYQMGEISAFGNRAAVLCNAFTSSGQKCGVNLYENGVWRVITDTGFIAKVSSGKVTSGMKFDSSGNLWVAPGLEGKGLLRYDGTSWSKFEVSDSLTPYRSFTRVAVQPGTGRIWALANVEIVEKVIGGDIPVIITRDYHEIWEFNGSGFRNIYFARTGNELYELEFSPDGKSLWSVHFSGNKLLKFDVETGTKLGSYNLFFVPGADPAQRTSGSSFFLRQSKNGIVWFGYSGFTFNGVAGDKSGLNTFDPASGHWTGISAGNWFGALDYIPGRDEIVYNSNSSLVRRDASTGALQDSLRLRDLLPPGTDNRGYYYAESNGRIWMTLTNGVALYDPTLSVHDSEILETGTIFPNPLTGKNSGLLRIILPEAFHSVSPEFRLYAMQGTELEHGKLFHNGTEWQADLTVRGIAPGAYRLVVSQGVQRISLPLMIVE